MASPWFPAMKQRIIIAKATTAAMPVARPSRPSVRLTEFENPVMMMVAKMTNMTCESWMLLGLGIHAFWLSCIHDLRKGRVSVWDIFLICRTSWSEMLAYDLCMP